MFPRLGKIVLGILCLTTSVSAFAIVPRYGVSASTPIVASDPSHLEAYRFSAWYQPASLVWPHLHIYFDVSAGHWWVTNMSRHHSLNIYAIAPVLRYYFTINDYFSPYLHVSIGPSYLTQTKIDDRNLGIHFAFQDQLGVGATFGKTQQLSVTLTALHYSNGSMSRWNRGLSVPVMLVIDYGFA